MEKYERFGECVKRCLAEGGLSASEAARLVGFRSRNSIFRILSGDVSDEVKLRFLKQLYEQLGDVWPEQRWAELQEALSVERLGVERYQANRAFQRVLYDQEGEIPDYQVCEQGPDGREIAYPLADLLEEVAALPRAELIVTGSCDSGLSRLLKERCSEAGAQGRLSIRQYIDTAENVVTQNIINILPLVSAPWYNARLVDDSNCPPEMMAVYRMSSLHIHQWDEQGQLSGRTFVRCDSTRYLLLASQQGSCRAAEIIDRWRFHLELLKPMPDLADGTDAFVEYTRQYAHLEDNCAIYSIKPDVHFNCIPPAILESAVMAGFEKEGLAGGEVLGTLMKTLWTIHEGRLINTITKRKPTHLVYSLPAMKRFMQTGVVTDHFFIQRAYTVKERRQIIQVLLDAMRQQPYFNVHFLKEGGPAVCYEISCYEGKGVMLSDAFTGYDLGAEHSEALITLPAFRESFKRYFKDELLVHYVMSRTETIRALEELLLMELHES